MGVGLVRVVLMRVRFGVVGVGVAGPVEVLRLRVVVVFVRVLLLRFVHGVRGLMSFGGVAVLEDVDFGGGDAGAVDFFDAEGGADVEGCGGFVQGCCGDSGVQESTEEHVAGDAGEALEEGDAHGVIVSRDGSESSASLSALWRGRGGWRR